MAQQSLRFWKHRRSFAAFVLRRSRRAPKRIPTDIRDDYPDGVGAALRGRRRRVPPSHLSIGVNLLAFINQIN